MKQLATLHDDKGRCIGIVDGPDEQNQSINVDGEIWRFDFDKHFGPLWLCKDGFTAKKNQNPPQVVWEAFNRWFKARRDI